MTLPISIEHARELARLREHGSRPDFVVIGAAALGHHVPLPRTTHDVDLALVVPASDLEPLLASLGWTRDARIPHRWYGPAEFRADVLPATSELVETGVVRFDDGDREMSLVGFDLALEYAIEVELPDASTSVKVASLASLVILKIVAWLDRPRARTKDLGDLATVLEAALADDDELRWDAAHPIASSGLVLDDQSPFFVGLAVAAIAHDSHRERIEHFVDKLLDESGMAAAAMAGAAGFPPSGGDERAQRLVAAFARGLHHRA